MRKPNLIALTVVAVLLTLAGQYLLAQTCLLIDSQEMAAILGAEKVPNCDCTSTDGSSCDDPFPPNCTTSSDCVGCNDSHYDEACNAYDAWDAADCVTDADWACEPKMIATCAEVSGQKVCQDPEDVLGVACNGDPVMEQCHY